jgi:hypothetical protein
VLNDPDNPVAAAVGLGSFFPGQSFLIFTQTPFEIEVKESSITTVPAPAAAASFALMALRRRKRA